MRHRPVAALAGRWPGILLCILLLSPAGLSRAAGHRFAFAPGDRPETDSPAGISAGSPSLIFSPPGPPLERGLSLTPRVERRICESGPEGGTASEPVPERAPAPPPPTVAKPDWEGLGRDTGYLIGYQLLGFGVLYCLPENVSNWSNEDKTSYDFSKYTYNISNPVWDGDKFYVNYILHPYWGSAYYLDARGRGVGRWGSFLYSAFASCLYEFGTEAFAEPVSIQDIVVTPIGGALLGVWLEGYWAELVARGEARSWGDTTLLYLVDPLGQVNRHVDGYFGFGKPRPAVGLRPLIGRVSSDGGSLTGVELSLRF